MGTNVSKKDTNNVNKGKENANRETKSKELKSADSGPKHAEKQNKDLEARQTKQNVETERKEPRGLVSKASNWFVNLSYWQTQDLATLMGDDELRDEMTLTLGPTTVIAW